MHAYLAGPMRGYPDFNYPAFNQVTATLKDMGYRVFNPADPRNHPPTFTTSTPAREFMSIDLAFICDMADLVIMMPGWETSLGACAEHATARACGLPILYINPDGEPHLSAKLLPAPDKVREKAYL